MASSDYKSGVYGKGGCTKITKLDELKQGDQILWDRQGYDHHAIVTKVDLDNQRLQYIEFTGDSTAFISQSSASSSSGEAGQPQQAKGRIEENEDGWNAVMNNLYIRNHESSLCEVLFEEEWRTFVVLFARLFKIWNNACESSNVDELRALALKYNLQKSNCEHLATVCRTGRWESKQAEIGFEILPKFFEMLQNGDWVKAITLLAPLIVK